MNNPGDSDQKPAFPWMVGAAASQTPKTAKRRQTMAEMLRSSELMGSTVSLHEAVEAAQEAAARKAEAAESPTAEIAPPAAVEAPAAPSPAPEIVAAPVRAPVAPDRETRSGGNRYHLYVKSDGIWIWQFTVNAASHREALSQSLARMTPEYDRLPIRMEQDESLVGS